MKKAVRSSAVAVVILSLATAKIFASPNTPSTAVSRGELRDLTLEMLADTSSARENADTIAKLIRDYRSDESNKTPVPAIADGPLIGYAASQILPGIWTGIYDSALVSELAIVAPAIPAKPANPADPRSVAVAAVPGAPLDAIFDLVMGAVAGGTKIPGAGSIPACLAKKALEGASPSCHLNLDETSFDEPGTITLLGDIVNCVIPIHDKCRIRRTVFDAAKKSLIKARDQFVDDHGQPATSTVLQRAVGTAFPGTFRTTVLALGAQLRTQAPQLLNDKFKGTMDPLWTKGDTAESDEFGNGKMSMGGYARGITTDITAAALFAQSDDATQRGLGAALLYAAANRLAYLMGGSGAKWDATNKQFVLAALPLQPMASPTPDPSGPVACPSAAPSPAGVPSPIPSGSWMATTPPDLLKLNFETESFGGVGAGGYDAEKKIELSPWDFAGYTASCHPDSFRIFPAEFDLNGGVAHVVSAGSETERLEDMADLAISMEKFLTMTAENAPLGKFFGKISDPRQLTDTKTPVLFPVEGRQLAVGVLASALRNLIDPANGHADSNVKPGADRGGAGLAFYETVMLKGRSSELTHVATIAKMLEAALGLRDVILSGQTDLPAALSEYKGEIENALQVTALTLIAKQSQAVDGGFYEYVNHPEQGPRSLITNVEAIRALTEAYEATHTIAILQALTQAWTYLDTFWVEGATVPKMFEGPVDPHRAYNPSQMWSLIRLWAEVQDSASFKDAAQIPGWTEHGVWDKWNTRLQSLRKTMETRVKGGATGLNKVFEAS